MLIAAFIGDSRSGKTTLIEELIRHYVTKGKRVAAIKHTHHQLNDRNEGDTARFVVAGAMPVIFAGDGEAIVFPSRERIAFDDARELVPRDADVVLIEGFKSVDIWPRIELHHGAWRSADEVVAFLDKMAGPWS